MLALMFAGPLLVYPLAGLAAVGIKGDEDARTAAKTVTVVAPDEVQLPEHVTRKAWTGGRDWGDARARLEPRGATVFFDSSSSRSELAKERLEQALNPLRTPKVVLHDRADPVLRSRLPLARATPGALALAMLLAGVYTALDVITGERERGTLETLLTSASDRSRVLHAKFLVILAFALTGGLLTLTSGSVALATQGTAPPLGGVLGCLVFAIPLALVVSILLTVAAALVPDFRTGQVATLPVVFLPAGAAAAAAVPSLHATPLVAVLPVTGCAVAMRETILGRFDPLFLALAFGGAALQVALLGVLAARVLGRESMVAGSRQDRRARGDWLPEALVVSAVAWLLLWFVGQWMRAQDLTSGLVGTMAIWAALAVATVAWTGLPMRATLGWRTPSVREMARAGAVGVLMPAVALTAVATQDAIFGPTPPVDLGLPDLPAWALLALVALLPGLCEEMIYRGAIMGLLMRGRGALVSIGVAAMAFSLAHVAASRLGYTLALGVLLGVLRWRGRSIAGSVLAHALNNGLAVGAALAGLPLEFAWWMVPASGVAIWIAVRS
jgi:membrane protease YdiL (CAAX protease family)/ABC-type Na+ efflux pump permease subunit